MSVSFHPIGESLLGARQKINTYQVAGSIGVAAVVGLAFGSWVAFAVTGGLLIALGLHNREIRLGGRRRK